jgi:hypothetical protein
LIVDSISKKYSSYNTNSFSSSFCNVFVNVKFKRQVEIPKNEESKDSDEIFLKKRMKKELKKLLRKYDNGNLTSMLLFYLIKY